MCERCLGYDSAVGNTHESYSLYPPAMSKYDHTHRTGVYTLSQEITPPMMGTACIRAVPSDVWNSLRASVPSRRAWVEDKTLDYDLTNVASGSKILVYHKLQGIISHIYKERASFPLP